MKTPPCRQRRLVSALVLVLGCWLAVAPLAAAQVAELDSIAVDSAAVDSLQAAADSLGAAAAADTLVADAVAGEVLEARLRSIFSNIDEFSDIDVTVSAGVVRLTGTVPRPEEVEDAAELVQTFRGVIYVDNDLTAQTDLKTRVLPTLFRLEEYVVGIVEYLPILLVAFLIVLLFWMASRVVGRWEAPQRRFGIDPLLWDLIRRLIGAALFMLGLGLAFDILGVTALVGAVLGTVGVVGLAIGFAFQDIVENYLAGLLLSLRQPFEVNDLVRVAEFEGKVIRLTSRELVLLSFEGNHVRLPNALVFKNPLTNFTRNPRRLFHFDVGVGTEEDLAEAMRLGVETLRAMKGVMDDPAPFARVQLLGDSTVTVRFHGWVYQQDADFLKVRSEAIRLVKAALDEAGVEMPEPIYRVNLRQPSDQAPAKARAAGPSIAERAETIDVAPDSKLEDQVRADLASSDEENLLSH